jgi:hypothetical protein
LNYAALSPDQLRHRPRKNFRLFLRQVVAGARHQAVDAMAGEFWRARGTVGAATPSPSPSSVMVGTAIGGSAAQPALDVGVLRIAGGHPKTMAIAVDHDIEARAAVTSMDCDSS